MEEGDSASVVVDEIMCIYEVHQLVQKTGLDAIESSLNIANNIRIRRNKKQGKGNERALEVNKALNDLELDLVTFAKETLTELSSLKKVPTQALNEHPDNPTVKKSKQMVKL